MIKRELLALQTLKATPKMMEMARQDEKKKREAETHWGKTTYLGYENSIFLRCQTLKGYLKVAMFLTERMRSGDDMPVYELFISADAGQFLTWDSQKQRWSEAMADNLPWSGALGWNWRDKGIWINPEGNQTIKRYLGTEEPGLDGIVEWQRKIRAQNIEARYKRMTDPWDRELAQTPALPKNFNRWLAKEGNPEQFIFYDYKKSGQKEGYCTFCEKTVPIEKPIHNKKTVCNCCGRAVTLKCRGRAKNLGTKDTSAYLLQRTETGFVVRVFYVSKGYREDRAWEERLYEREVRRVFYDGNARRMGAYGYELFRGREQRFCKIDRCWLEWDKGAIYPEGLKLLADKELKKTGLPEYVAARKVADPLRYLSIYQVYPEVEQLAKVGLMALTEAYLMNGVTIKDMFDWRSKGSLAKKLRLDESRLKRLRACNGGRLHLQWLQSEKRYEENIPDEVICYFSQNKIARTDLGFILDRLSVVQVYNYMKKQGELADLDAGHLLTVWKDYLNMAQKFKMKTEDPYVYRPSKLKQRHDELVVRGMMKDMEKAAAKTAKDYPKVEAVLKEIKDIYSFQGERYCVIVPDGILDIMVEGKALRHCVGTSTRYLDRIERRESYIMFLRKTESPQESYYTLEVEPGGTVRQKRTTNDEQKADIEDAKKFLQQWQKEISTRLTQQERSLAGKSKQLRMAGFEG